MCLSFCIITPSANANPRVDPVEDMKMKDESYMKLLRKVRRVHVFYIPNLFVRCSSYRVHAADMPLLHLVFTPNDHPSHRRRVSTTD
jgi:hypothetical protein